MKFATKAYASIVSLVIGMFLLLEGSRMIHLIYSIDLVFIVVGAMFVLAYLPLMGDYLELNLRGSKTVTFMPILLVLGLVLVYQGAVIPLSVVEKGLFVVLEIVLISVPAFVLCRAAKRR
ncbi:MAG: hypothetical protein OEX16_02715 [Hadesarchaea archaeon]|nr:hypothetical protein [Hadesarchaea archaeon]MDH5685231.1 hypothetical protein [Hadesarchaea archaeon]